jgi:ferredoxin-2, mitochondrial
MEFITLYIRDKNSNLHEIQLPNDPAFSLMELLRAAELPILGTCGGMALCASCHIYIHSPVQLHEQNEAEERLLDSLMNSRDNSRLSCQIRMSDKLEGLILEIADC